jgi:hypothetical protein
MITLDQQAKRVADRINYTIESLIGELVVDTFNKIKQNVESTGGGFGSPVLTGRYYTSHRISFGTLDTTVSPEAPEGTVYPELGFFNVDDFVDRFTLGQTVYISNALPYAIDLEEGYSQFKAPQGIYGVSLSSAEAYYVSQGVNKASARAARKFPPIVTGVAA